MPVNWNPEAEARLFLGVLAQFKDANLKLDYKALAEYMGPECSVSAVKQRVQKLRRDAESPPASGGGPVAPSPAGGQKRKTTGGGQKGGRGKKAKVEEKKAEEKAVEEESEKNEE